MIKIAICDDEEKAIALHEKIVKVCLQAQGVGYEITTYGFECDTRTADAEFTLASNRQRGDP